MMDIVDLSYEQFKEKWIIEHLCYELYKFNWIREHIKSPTITQYYATLDLVKSFSEFIDNEYQDEQYVKELLNNNELFAQYKKGRLLW